MLKFEYNAEDGIEIGTRDCRDSDRLIDEVLRSTPFYAEVHATPAFRLLQLISVGNYGEDAPLYRCHMYPNVSGMNGLTRFQVELWNELTVAKREELAKGFDSILHNDIKSMTEPGMVMIGWYRTSEFEIVINLSPGLCCGTFESQLRNTEQSLSGVWDEVARVSAGVTSNAWT